MRPFFVFAAATAAAFVAVPAVAQTQGLTVGDFLSRVQAMVQGGRASADTPERRALFAEVAAAGRAVRAQQAADRQAGRPAVYCIPEQAAADTSLITYMMSLPADQRSKLFTEAFGNYVKTKYPCPA